MGAEPAKTDAEHAMVSADLARSFVRRGEAAGVPRGDLLGVLGPDSRRLAEADAQIPARRIMALWQTMGAALPRHPVGLAPEPAGGDGLGALAHLARYAVTGRQGRLGFEDLVHAVSTHVELRVETNARGDVRVRCAHLPAVERVGHPIDYVLSRLVDLTVGSPSGVVHASLKHRPWGDAKAYTRRFQRVRFEAEHNELTLGAEALDRPRPHADPALVAFLRRRLEAQASGVVSARGFAVRLRRAVDEGAAAGEFRGDGLAKRVHVSERQLQRLARARGLSPRRLVDDARRNAVLRALADPRLSLEEVAERADYADARSLRRAFVRWTGTTPAAWRRRG